VQRARRVEERRKGGRVERREVMARREDARVEMATTSAAGKSRADFASLSASR
jgi:hypothetical protein